MNKLSLWVPSLAACCTLALSGCVTPHESLIKDDNLLSYVEGFDAGCLLGGLDGSRLVEQVRTDLSRLERDGRYAQGWSDGFHQCESPQAATERRRRINSELQKLSEQKQQSVLKGQYRLEQQAPKGSDGSAPQKVD